MSGESPVESLSFEAALSELEPIVEKLEGGDVALEESIKIYERGAALKAHCMGKLKSAQLKVESCAGVGRKRENAGKSCCF